MKTKNNKKRAQNLKDLKKIFFQDGTYRDNTSLNEERLTALIREIFREESEKQQKNLFNLVTGNLEITMKEIKSIKTKISDLKDILKAFDDFKNKQKKV